MEMLMFSDKAVRALQTAHGAEILPGEGRIVVPSTTIVVPTFTLSRGEDVQYARFPTGDLILAALAAGMGGEHLAKRIATAIRRAADGEVSPAAKAVVEAAKGMVREEVLTFRVAPLKID